YESILPDTRSIPIVHCNKDMLRPILSRVGTSTSTQIFAGRASAAGSVRSQHSYGLNRGHDHEPHASSETRGPEISKLDGAAQVVQGLGVVHANRRIPLS